MPHRAIIDATTLPLDSRARGSDVRVAARPFYQPGTSLPLGTAYTIWTGIGAVGAFIVGIALLGEWASPMRIGAAALIVGGLVLLKLFSPA